MVREGLLVAGAIAAAVLWAPPAAAEIRIAVAGPMTGAYAWFGEQYQRGTGLAVEDLNAAGGVLGQQVQLITADDFCDPEQAVAAAQKLVSDAWPSSPGIGARTQRSPPQRSMSKHGFS